jgi:hypothetical protein
MKVFFWTVFALCALVHIAVGLVVVGWWIASALPRSF